MNNARVYLPGVLDTGLELELFNVFDEFLQKSKFWQEDINYTTILNTTSYALTGTQPGAMTDLMTNVNANGAYIAASMGTLATLDLVASPTQVEVLTATVAYTVFDPADVNGYPQIPADMLHKYGVGILAGLIGRMMTQPAKPWTNQQLGIFNIRKFNGTVAQARADVRHENIYDGQTWRYPNFARGRQR